MALSSSNKPVTRLAPSPTGALHLGNARTFLLNWLLAKLIGAKIILRIDDIDGPRVKPQAAEQAIRDLEWLGLDWDEGPYYQTQRMELYREALSRLEDAGLTYPCVCSRKDIETAASAPHGDTSERIYPGTCSNRFASYADANAVASHGHPPAIRFRTGTDDIVFDDQFAGPQRMNHARLSGDFVIAKDRRTPAYQLANVVDDETMGVTQVLRGDDLLPSTARQISLIDALGYRRIDYAHTPLLVGEDGRRLAKRHGDTRISTYRKNGVPATRIVGWLAAVSGLNPSGEPRSAASLIEGFSLQRVPHEPVTVTRAAHRTLGGK